MSRTIKWSITFLLLFALILEIHTVYAKMQSVSVDTQTLNIRSGPGLIYDVTGSLKKGDRIEVINSSDDWLEIRNDTQTGWIASWFTKSDDEISGPSKTIVSLVDSLNVRTGPSVNSEVLGKMNAGDEAVLASKDKEWANVEWMGKNGWVYAGYVTEKVQPIHTSILGESHFAHFTVAVNALNVREKPDLTSNHIGLIEVGETFEIKEFNGNWVRIPISNDQDGWVYTFHGIISSTSNVKDNVVNTPKTVTLLSNGTNIRESASTASDVIMQGNAGDKFEIISDSGDWYELMLPTNESAFIAKWVVTTDNSEIISQEVKPQIPREIGTLNGITIVIDPGHGGNDYGTTGTRGTNEKDLNVLTADLLVDKLKSAGATVHLTRESDDFVSLKKRVSISHQYNADAFISIHYDSNPDSSINGFTTYYTHGRQHALAAAVNEGLASTITLRNRGAQPGDYLVIRENMQNAILIELGFLSNPSEELNVTTDAFRNQATLGITKGLLEYFDAQIK